MSTVPIFRRVALIGFGLIGGSIARAVRAQGLASEIVTTARSEKTRARVTELGIVDRVLETNAEAVNDADLVILCIPVGACGQVAQEIAPFLKAGAIVSDAGSVKGAIVREMAPHLPGHVHFVPAHPVAGTEHSGPDSGFAELFINRWCILTPPEGADPMAVETLRAFWAGMGAKVETMTPDHHDLVLAITSHLPHLIAYTIVGTADELAQVTSSEVIKFSAGGFRDFTRIAASDPTMWRDVFLNNKEGRAGNARHLQRGPFKTHPRHPPRRRRGAVRAFHPHPRHPPRHRRDRPGFRRARLRPPASAAGEEGGVNRTESRRLRATLHAIIASHPVGANAVGLRNFGVIPGVMN
ncbi:prephenate dehydrogenase [Bradyrhizobium sp. AZCC 1588]